MNIVLTGFMGTGKSTIGKLLAEELKKDFIDTDLFIERRYGKSIPQIFEEEGEERFRELEANVIKEIAKRKNAVISCGGGVVLNPVNVERLRKKGRIVLLTASLEDIMKRISEDRKRPLLRKYKIETLLKLREPIYFSVADFIVNTTDVSVEETVNIIKGWYCGSHY